MKTRALTGIVFVAVMIGSLLLGPFVFVAFYLILSAACLHEFYRLLSSGNSLDSGTQFGGLLGFAGLALASGYVLDLVPVSVLFLCFLLVPIVFLTQLFRQDQDPFGRVGRVVLGWLYILLPFFCFIGLGFISRGTGAPESPSFHFALPFSVLVLIWANDTGAYILGRAFGKHKLFERISPGKTWEGFIGGLLSSLVVSSLLYRYFGILSQGQWAMVAFVTTLFGTLGDLVESMLKRSLGVKDSGSLLPGHGGLLDRFDSLLFVAPVIYATLLTLM